MKKIFLFLLMLSMIVLASCSSEENVMGLSAENETEVSDSTFEQVQRNLELMTLQDNIHDYKLATFGEQQNPMTRGWFKRVVKGFAKFVATIAADAVGGVLGGVPGGITASGIVGGALLFKVNRVAIVPTWYPTTRIVSPPKDTEDNDSTGGFGRGWGKDGSVAILEHVVPTNPISVGDSIGYYHNKVLCEVFSDTVKVASFVKKSKQEQAQIIIDAMKEEPYLCKYYGNDLNDQAKINTGVDVANTIMQIAEEAETEEEFFARVEDAGLGDTYIMDVLREILEGFDNIDPETDTGEYYEAVLDLIQNSGLDKETKQNLTDGVIIGQASNRLWKGNTFNGIYTGLDNSTEWNPGGSIDVH